MRRLLPSVTVVTLSALLAATLCADEVVLTDGRRFRGEVLRQSEDSVVIKTVGGTMVFDRDEVARVIIKADPKKVYAEKLKKVKLKAVVLRLELARWCVTHDLHVEARMEVEQLLLVDPGNADAQALLARLVKRSGTTFSLSTEVTLTDGSRVKGKLLNPLFTLETDYGLLHVPTRSITGIEIGEKRTPDVIVTKDFKVSGRVSEELFVVDSKLGRLTIAKKDIRAITIYQPTAGEMVEIEFNADMRQLNALGLDVILVVDATDSMVGVLKHLRGRMPQLCRVIRKFVPNSQFGLVAFRDRKEFDREAFEYTTKLFALTSKKSDFIRNAAALRAKGGGDVPEAVFDGLALAMTRGGWRPTSRRIIILIGDAPPHHENRGITKIYKLVRDWHRNTQGILHCVDTTGYNRLMIEFRNMARDGGGKSLIVNDEKTILRDIIPLILGVRWQDRFIRAFDEKTPAPR